TEDGPGPGFFPLWYGAGILACSAYLVAFSKETRADWRGIALAFALWGAIALSVALLQLVGFAISFGALSFFIVAVMYRRPAPLAALVALCVAAGFYLIFPFALGVALP